MIKTPTFRDRPSPRGGRRCVFLVAVVACLGVPPPAFPQAPVRIEWTAEIPTSGEAVGNAVLELSDGDLLVTGYEVTRAAGNQGVLARLAPDGAVRWARSYGGPGDDFLWDASPTGDGGFVAVGFTGPDRGVDVWVLHTDGAGEVVWERHYGGTGRDRAWSITGDGVGGWYVAAERTPPGSVEQDAWLLRLAPSGDTLWTRTLGGPESQRVFSVATLPRGDAVIVGGTGSNDRRSGDNDMLVARFSADGRLVWRSVFGGERYDVGHAVVAAGQGVLVTGYGTPESNESGDTDLLLLRLNGDGDVLWRHSRPGRGHERAIMSAPGRDGGWITVGFALATDVDLRLWATGMDGEPRWRWTRPSPGLDRGVMVRPTGDGGFVVTGAFAHGSDGVAPIQVLKLREG